MVDQDMNTDTYPVSGQNDAPPYIYRELPSIDVEVDTRPFPGMHRPLTGTYTQLRPHENA